MLPKNNESHLWNHKCFIVKYTKQFPFPRCHHCYLPLRSCFMMQISTMVLASIVLFILFYHLTNPIYQRSAVIGIVVLLLGILFITNRHTEKMKMNEYKLKELSENLQGAKDYLGAVLKLIPAGVIIMGKDKKIRKVNELTMKMFGIDSEDQIVGKTCHKFICPADEGKCPIIDLGQKVDNSERVLLNKNGEKLPILKTVTEVNIGGENLLLEVFLDVSERNQAEKSLRQSENKYRLLIENIPQKIFYKDRNSVYISCNENYAHDLKIKSEEIAKKTDYDFFPKELAEKYRADDKRIMDLGNTEDIEEKYIQDGQEVWVYTIKTPVNDEKGNCIGILGIFWDITDRKKAEEEKEEFHSQLLQSSKMSAIGTMAGGIAHDFNNLLFIIQGNIEFLQSELPESAKELHVLADNIKSSAVRGAELINKLMVFARKEQYRLEPTNINQVVEDMVGLLKRTIEKMISIETYLEPNLGVVMADASQIHQAILNICINANDAMSHHGKLTIETRNVVIDEHYVSTYLEAHPGKFVMILISDTGIGMDKETCAHLFEPFFTTKERGKGVGLGLPVTYGIVKAHNGFINVYSEKGKGTCFKIYLPISEEKMEEKPIVKDKEIFEKGTGTILLIDDEVQILDLGKRILEKYGYKVILANNGKEALEIYQQRKNEIILVILDFVMPGWSGKETFEELRKINSDVKVLIATGYSLNSHGEELMSEGVKGFIQKPFSIKELLEEIKKILGKPR
ncbi:MAG: PAS domain S-box protein [Planctomycetota bacterium]